MIDVKLNRKINNHLRKGTKGRISDNDFNLWGVGPKVAPMKVTLFLDDDEMAILNTSLDLDRNDEKHTAKTEHKQIKLL